MKPVWVLSSFFTVLIYITTLTLIVESAISLQLEQSTLEVQQNKKTGLISVRAKDVSLNKVIQRVSHITGLTVKSSDASILDESVEINLKDLTLKEAIDRLLQGVNSVFFYSSEPATGKDKAPGLIKVMLLSRKEALPSGAITNQKGDLAKTKMKAQINQVRLQLLTIIKSPLGRSILEKKMSETQRILNELLETGTEEEIAEAIAALGDILTQSSLYNQARNGHVFYEALDAFKKLDPQGGTVQLTNLLQTDGEPWVQSLAATGLGELGQTSAIAPLTTAFASGAPLVQDAAANSLAKIGTDIGIGELFKATESGGPALKQEIINALALDSGEKSQTALNQAVVENLIPAESISEEAVDKLTQSENPEHN